VGQGTLKRMLLHGRGPGPPEPHKLWRHCSNNIAGTHTINGRPDQHFHTPSASGTATLRQRNGL